MAPANDGPEEALEDDETGEEEIVGVVARHASRPLEVDPSTMIASHVERYRWLDTPSLRVLLRARDTPIEILDEGGLDKIRGTVHHDALLGALAKLKFAPSLLRHQIKKVNHRRSKAPTKYLSLKITHKLRMVYSHETGRIVVAFIGYHEDYETFLDRLSL
ncbi:MAG: hypothetical protein ACD_62C00692G0011 [uncultured bacterium]|nr:MAG: hypothetical protein ACD_62C00692G0011 [uncultured bacterium]